MSGIKVVPSVFVIIEKDGKFLLLRRKATGYMDGWYDLPAGHLEDQEKLVDGAVRELKEEVGVIADPKNLKLVHVYQNHTNQEVPHYGYIFLAELWSGRPKIMEPNKCDGLDWFSLAELPEKTLPYTRQALGNLRHKDVSISYHEPKSISN